ncbi:MAG: hypothetical protein IJY01_05505 [Clostridia bacterium]|nr:hypothetical protein [Clostridia bacterium]
MQENTLFSNRSKSRDYLLWTVALVSFFNPCVNIIDIFPDFIGCLILAGLFASPALVAPYFSEARAWLLRAAAVSALKIPALAIVVVIRSGNTQDNDVIALVALIFLALDLICLIPAISNIFSALFYLGERGDASSLLKGDGRHSPEGIKSLCIAFVIIRGAASALPELLRLTRAVELGDSSTVIMRGSRFYPYAVVAAAVISLAVGILFLIRCLGYLRAIRKEGKFYPSLEALADMNTVAELKSRQDAVSNRRMGIFLTLSALLTFEISFSNLGEVNLLPPTVSAIFLILALFSLIRLTGATGRPAVLCRAVAIIYGILTLPTYILQLLFHDEYAFRDLVDGGSRKARAFYGAITALSAVELVFGILAIAVLFFLLRGYTDRLVIKLDKDTLSPVDLDRRRGLIIKCGVLCSLFALVFLSRFIQVVLRGAQVAVSTGGDASHSSIIYAQSAPWFSVVATLLTVACTLFSVYLIGTLREERAL